MDSTGNETTFAPKEDRSGLLKKLAIGLLLSCVFVGVILLTIFLSAQKSHLVLGVPYEGHYRGTLISTDAGAAAYSILGYWGDNRFSREDIESTFTYAIRSKDREIVSISKLAQFFEEAGYNVEQIPANNIRDLEKHINNDVPLIVLHQLFHANAPSVAQTFTVLIGYSKNKNLEFHDNNFGNNYLVPYEMYDSSNLTFSPRALVISPKDEIRSSLSGPDTTSVYPARLSIMDDPSMQSIQVNYVLVDRLVQIFNETGKPTGLQISELLEKIIAEPAFEKLHPAARVYVAYKLARNYLYELDQPERAAEVLNQYAIPVLDSKVDFSQPYGEWERNLPEGTYGPFWYSNPFALLGFIYQDLGNVPAAREAAQKALDINPEDQNAQTILQSTNI